jgi:hypothetical protein
VTLLERGKDGRRERALDFIDSLPEDDKKRQEFRQKVEADFVFAKRGADWSVSVGIFKTGMFG